MNYSNAALYGSGTNYSSSALAGMGRLKSISMLLRAKTPKGSAAAKAKMAYLRSLRRRRRTSGGAIRGGASLTPEKLKELRAKYMDYRNQFKAIPIYRPQ